MRITRLFVLLALAALLAPHAEASRTSVWERNPPASLTVTKDEAAGLLASLAPAARFDASAQPGVEPAEPPLFNLGDVAFVESALEHEVRFDLGPLTLVDLNLLRGPPPSYPETRVGGFDLLPPFRVGASASLSLWSRQACGFSCREVVSDSRYDPWGLSWSTFAYGVLEGAINLAIGTAQTMARPYLPAALNNVNVSVNLTQPGKPVASASVPTVTEQLKSASTVIPVGEMLGRFGANLALTVQGWFDPTASQEYLDEVHADLGRDTPGTAMVVAPLALKGGAAIRAGIEGRLPAFENPYTPEALSSNPLVSPRPAPPMGAYGDLSGTLPRGMQANHLNQNAAYRSVIPSDQGTAMGLYGDAFRQPGTQHFSFHGSLESFWRPYRMGGGRFGSRPTNAQYSDALRGALRAAMLPEEDVALGVADAARQRAAFGLRPDDPVPNIPRRLPQKRGP